MTFCVKYYIDKKTRSILCNKKNITLFTKRENPPLIPKYIGEYLLFFAWQCNHRIKYLFAAGKVCERT